MPRIQPGNIIGPNNAGKMILRGCFMNVSEEWITRSSREVGGLLTRYLNNRQQEATPISLKFGESIPVGREHGPHRLDVEFMANVTYQLRKFEKSGNDLLQASSEDIYDQVGDQVVLLRQSIQNYEEECAREGIEPMFTGVPSVIIENVLNRKPATHAQSLLWEPVVAAQDPQAAPQNLFEGLTIRVSPTSK
ncbi:Uncharacterised protein [Legionella steigerwaltii]|uniref:Uncharacterized protein n=1 Tax=Legionella steigerwaltii TaxID=460 RepID=A0A378LEW9_9GAMM|nr:hypothetical protein [Legionella steigerwaltii]KTD78015.1 hypothetical protein Lstg_1497 [Legionella steigerwaltii]STY24412.1 Uncharacterised protein [Legionella steigerwaltii]